MAKRIISSFLAFALVFMALVVFGVAVINVIEHFYESFAALLFNGISGYLSYMLQHVVVLGVFGPSNMGIAMKLILPLLLVSVATVIVSYKKTKVWEIIRKVSLITTACSLVLFIAVNFVTFLIRNLVLFVLTIACIADIGFAFRYYFYDAYHMLFKMIWSGTFLNVLTILLIIIASACIAYVIYKLLEKNMTEEEKLKRDLKLAKERKEKLENKINKMNEKYVTLKSENSNDK